MMNKIFSKIFKSRAKRIPRGSSAEDAVNKEVIKLKKYHLFIEDYINFILRTEKEIEEKIREIEIKTEQHLVKDELVKGLWILRYAFFHFLFFETIPSNNANDVVAYLKLITHALRKVLNKANKSNYLPWLSEGFSEFMESDELEYRNLKEFKSNFAEQIAERTALIAFRSTEGRLGGEQHDSVIELVMTTISSDKEYFSTGNSNILGNSEMEIIKTAIKKLSGDRIETVKDFFDSLK